MKISRNYQICWVRYLRQTVTYRPLEGNGGEQNLHNHTESLEGIIPVDHIARQAQKCDQKLQKKKKQSF